VATSQTIRQVSLIAILLVEAFYIWLDKPNDLQSHKISNVAGVVILDTEADENRPSIKTITANTTNNQTSKS